MATAWRKILWTATAWSAVAVTAALAQPGRSWVDPPSEGGPPVTAQPAPKVTTPDPVPAADAAPRLSNAAEKALEKQARSKARSEVKLKRTRKAETPRRASRSADQLAPSTTGSIAGRRSAAGPRNGRVEQVQRGIDRGLEVMTLRTIQLPDGRRVQILTRPDPDSLSQALGDGY